MAAPIETTSQSPDWNLVPFEVGCARCGHDLRGLDEPVCPGCGLAFDWSEAVPIESLTCVHCDYRLYGLTETRCPECGQPFTWEEVLSSYHRRKYRLFEYRWLESPVRSYLHSLFQALRPRRFWQGFDLHDPPAVKPLIVMAAGSLILAAVVAGVAVTLQFLVMAWLWPGIRMPLDAILRNAVGVAGLLGGVGLLWSVLSLVALMIFRQSMKRFKVRTRQVVRVWAYAVPLLFPMVVVLLFCLIDLLLAIEGLTAFQFSIVLRAPAEVVVPTVVLALWLAHVMRSIRHGYGTYLRMWHGWGIALASQVIAVLATITLLVVWESL